MALSPEESLKLCKAEKDALRQEIFKLTDLLIYYRDQLPHVTGDETRPPPLYFVVAAKDWSYGVVEQGTLKMLGKAQGSEAAAVAACWQHYHGLHSAKIKKLCADTRARQSQAMRSSYDGPPPMNDGLEAAPDDEPALDLSLDDEPSAPAPVVRRRRRRVAE